MKKINLAVWALVLLGVSCKMKTDMKATPALNVDYPAAYVVNGESNSVSVIKLSDNTLAGTIDLTQMPMPGMSNMMSTGVMWPHHISINPSKTKLAIGVPGMDFSGGHAGGMMGMMGKIVILDATTGVVIQVIDLPVMNHNAIFSPNGSEIWTAEMMDNGMVKIFDASNYKLKDSIKVKMQPSEVTFSADGAMAFVANGGSDTVTVINCSNKKIMGHVAVGHDPVGAWTGADGNMYVDNETGQSITVIKVSDMSVVTTITLGFTPGIASYNSAMGELWVTDPDHGKVHWYTKSGTTYTHGGEFATGAGCHAIAFSTDGMTAYVTNQLASSVSVADVMTHMESKEIMVGHKPNGIVIK